MQKSIHPLRLLLAALPLLLLDAQGAGAQQVDTVPAALRPTTQSKMVEVSRAFAPSIQDANRMHSLPRLDDTAFAAQPFTYTLVAKPLVQSYSMRPLPAARVGREPLPPLYPYYVKLGLGNYYSPLAQFHYSSGHSARGSLSASLRHVSSFGSRRLADGQLTQAPSSDTRTTLQGTLAFPTLALDGAIAHQHLYDTHYGRRDSAYQARNPLWGKHTSAHRYGLRVAARSTHTDSSHFNYDARAAFDGYADSRQMVQSLLHASMRGHMYVRRECYGAELCLDHILRDMASLKAPNTLFSIMPWAKLFGNSWRIVVGAQVLLDANQGNVYTHVYPMAHFSYDIVRHYFIPYLEVDGGLERADYVTLRTENAWLTPGLLGWNASRKARARAGFKGNINARTSFDASISYALVDSAHFWVNRTAEVPSPITRPARIYTSDFGLAYDNVERVHAHAELALAVTDRYAVGAEADYWHYKMKSLQEPWHRPQYRVLVRASYNLRRKVYAGVYLHLEGGIRARQLDGARLDLPMAYDLSLDARYRFTDTLSLFLELRNILSAANQAYYLYPQQRFHGHAGVAFHF